MRTDERRTIRIEVRVDPEEKRRIQAKATGLCASAYLRLATGRFGERLAAEAELARLIRNGPEPVAVDDAGPSRD